ncbi:MAG: UDP-N-acetylmuramoyl-L-alanyl-D-glutamate--2,6-diaminopimelate ligase, partial [Acidimicrobiia bacterium]|nr:UDP-N-acetylmuramoyl-L-alanyl-D-glutamate--2,6-diaminopimelate ligase [Acidimicrobiia bacterium]
LVAALGRDVVVRGDPSTVVVDQVAYDSRSVGPGALFCCVPGQQVDGHAFASDAVRAGAVALLVEQRLAIDVVQVQVPDARIAMAIAAAELWRHPSRRLQVIGVTGTNGKTTVAHLIGTILSSAGRPCPVLGTLTGARTTPEAPDLQAALSNFLDRGAAAVAMEVSSHALALHRVDGLHFALAMFTNLSRDHLDFHGTEAAYFQAKARLFDPDLSARAVVNLDDPRGRLLRDAALIPTVGYALADAADVQLSPGGTQFRWRGAPMSVPLAGRHNLSNAIGAATAAAELDISVDAIARGLASVPRVPGRFEPVEAGQPFRVVVDYAHTPDALARVLEAAREITPSPGRVILVFGCGGDRDPSKRAPMGRVASRLANLVVLTSDNPRHEDPGAIIAAVRGGLDPATPTIIEPDRRAAIADALREARDGDIVVIAGKGHETTQVIGDVELPFEDRTVASELLANRAGDPA